MPQPLSIEATEETPGIIFDRTADALKICGRSYPENSQEFFTPVFVWLEKYSENPNTTTILDISLEYFNSSSIKQVFQLMYIIEDLVEMGKEAKIVWRCKEGDELMLQKGQEFKSFLDVGVEVIVY